MKILHIITSLRTGGSEKLMVDLLPRLKQQGMEVDLLLLDGTDTPFKKQLENNGIKILDAGKGGWVYSPIKFFKILPLIRKYDIIHTHNTASQLFGALASLVCSVVTCTTEHTTSNRRRDWKWYAPIDRWMYRRYQKIICISTKAEENLRKHIGNSKYSICTINNGVNVEFYANAEPSQILEIKAPGTKKIIMVAGFRWEKDQDTLIKALTKLPNKFHLFLVGDGVRRTELDYLMTKLELTKRVHFLGIRSDVANLLHEADYVVMSSHFEGLSLSSVEGMSVGKPFIASDVDGLHDVVTGTGVLFPHKDYNSLAKKIIELDSDREYYNAIATSCLKRARNFDISKMVEGYQSVYKKLQK